MAEDKKIVNAYSNDDTLDINELASLNDDFSTDFIEKLQNQIEQRANQFIGKSDSSVEADSELFEEIESTPPVDETILKENFNNQEIASEDVSEGIEQEVVNNITETLEKENLSKENSDNKENSQVNINIDNEIKNLTAGNIIEKPATQKELDYNNSLDYLDDNVKYSKYIIYVNPENKDFIDSLTVKERKNLINRLLREQDDIAITKRRLGLIQTVVRHCIISIITIAVTIPIAYWTINASLEATINNYRRSKTFFHTLYKEKGKIKSQDIK